MSHLIPPRQPIGDVFNGLIVQVNGPSMLAQQPVRGATITHSGEFIIRYGIRYLEKPQWSLVPGLLALDYGDMLTGEAAWNFILKKSNLYPRADVVGYRNDGVDDMVPLKRLDLAQPVEVLAFVDSSAVIPIASLVGLIAPVQTPIAPRILEHLTLIKEIDIS